MKSFFSHLNPKLFLIAFTFFVIFSSSLFAANLAVLNSSAECSTICSSAANSVVNTLMYPDTTKPTLSHSFVCSSSCAALCAFECEKFKEWIKNPGIADVTANVSSNSLTRSVCNALKVITGSAGKTFAAFAIIAVGIGFFSGKVSWGLMIGVAAGIAAMFGAPSIVAAISGLDTDMACNIN